MELQIRPAGRWCITRAGVHDRYCQELAKKTLSRAGGWKNNYWVTVTSQSSIWNAPHSVMRYTVFPLSQDVVRGATAIRV